jgi:ABC-2 type transport system ATP-binding protein
MNAAIRCSQLVMTYPGRPPVEAVRSLDLEVAQGECFGLLGPNGAGKTTTIEILEGLIEPTAGEAEVLGRHWGGPDDQEIRQRIGISLQETRLSEKLTVQETVTLFRSFYRHGLSADEAIAQVALQEKGAGPGRQVVGRTKTTVGRRLRLDRRSRTGVSRRADDGPRSAVAPAVVGHRARLP